MHWLGVGFGPVFMLAVLLIIVFVAVRGFGMATPLRGSIPADPPRRTARDILDERYARGEIKKAEYDLGGIDSKLVARQAATRALTVFFAVKLIASSSPG